MWERVAALCTYYVVGVHGSVWLRLCLMGGVSIVERMGLVREFE